MTNEGLIESMFQNGAYQTIFTAMNILFYREIKQKYQTIQAKPS